MVATLSFPVDLSPANRDGGDAARLGRSLGHELRDLEGLSYAEIGEHLDRSADAARKLHDRAVIRLGIELGKRAGRTS